MTEHGYCPSEEEMAREHKRLHHYHVLTGLQGCYMPNDNAVCRTKREALAVAREQKRCWNDSEYDKPRSERDFMRGSKGYYTSENESIEVTECWEADCWSEIEEG